MTTNYPDDLDSLIRPSGSDKLNTPSHSDHHRNLADSVEAVQAHVGVSGSTVTSSIEYRLHNTSSGHDHNGINSKPVALGTSGSTDFNSGYFTDFTTETRVGDAISQINAALKDISGALNILSGSGIAFELQGLELTPSAVRVNLTGSGVSGSVASPITGDEVTYVINGVDYRQILFLANNGPFENFSTSSMVKSMSYASTPFVSSAVWYTDVSKTGKIFEIDFGVRNSRKQSTEVLYHVYEPDGTTVKNTVQDLVTYEGPRESNRIRNIL